MGRRTKEFHAFYDVGDDEVQIDSFDRKMNEEVLALARAEPEEERPRCAVKSIIIKRKKRLSPNSFLTSSIIYNTA